MDIKVKAQHFVCIREGQKIRDYYRLGKELGRGAFGIVRVAVEKSTKNVRAVKVVDREKLDETELQLLMNEINNLKDLDHPNVL
jgi:serine/threonine protein kinase